MYHKTNQFQEALRCFGKVQLSVAGDKAVYIARGRVYQDMGNFQLAIKDFNKSIELDEKLAEGYYYRGLCRLASKNYH